jgi:uncharacterized protein YydD (DUF2326 family)
VSGLEQALKAELSPQPVDLQRLYNEAQVDLPDSALPRFDDVHAFHESVLRNRQSYLQAELKAAQKRLDARVRHRKEWDTRRAQVMAVLSSTGALEQFTQLQSELGRLELEGHAENLKRQTVAARQMEQTRLELESKRPSWSSGSAEITRSSVSESRRRSSFSRTLSGTLYEKPARLQLTTSYQGLLCAIRASCARGLDTHPGDQPADR